jgi:gas vesicle protein
MAKGNAKRFAITTALAAAAGYIVGVLTAPKSGKESRDDIKLAVDNSKAEVEKQLQHAQDELKKVIDQVTSTPAKLNTKAKAEFDDVISKANGAREKSQEVLRAVRKGSSDERELQVALNQARSALKHLRKYISK